MSSSTVGMCITTPEGTFEIVNDALCKFFGYDFTTLRTKTWQDLTAPERLEADLIKVEDILAGRLDGYRATKQFIDAAGNRSWGDMSVTCLRGPGGEVQKFIAQIIDVSAEMQLREQLIVSEQLNRVLAEGLQSELDSAAQYVRSVLPEDLDGQVSVSSRYLPSSTLGGDSYDFHWIDEDHLIFYVLDVSGHGVKSALIAVSVHNLLRSESLSVETMLEPDHVLAVLNHQFDTESHDDNFFTMFYAVYEASSATLRYASGGHPPALLMTDGQLTRLTTQGPPIGAIEDADFTTTTLPVRPGSQLLLYTDGAYELPLGDGGQWSLDEFVEFCTGLAGTPDWSLDEVIDNLRRRSAHGSFTDDCCLVRLAFD